MVQREPWSAGVTPERGSKRECPLLPLGLSRRRVRFSSLLTFMGTLPNFSAMANLYPSIVPGCNFLSWIKYRRKSAMAFRGGALKST